MKGQKGTKIIFILDDFPVIKNVFLCNINSDLLSQKHSHIIEHNSLISFKKLHNILGGE